MASNATFDRYKHLEHGFGPEFDKESKVLILGSFPSVKSREISFYYGHPRNRFWFILSKFFNAEMPKSIDDKRTFVHLHHVALYDVIDSCEIVGSSDASIKNVVTTDIFQILNKAKIAKILCNGATSGRLFEKYQLPQLGAVSYEILPSTSPANAASSFERLYEIWAKALSDVLP